MSPLLKVGSVGANSTPRRTRLPKRERTTDLDRSVLAAELAFREAVDRTALDRLAAAWLGTISGATSVVLFCRSSLGRVRAITASPARTIDRSSPTIRAWERGIASGDAPPDATLLTTPEQSALIWFPANHASETERAAATERVFQAYAHARKASRTAFDRATRALRPRWRWLWYASAAVVLALPVPLIVIVPAEVVASEPSVVTAPFDAAVRRVVVDARETVSAGDVLVHLDDNDARAALERARGELSIALAKLERSDRLASLDAGARADLPVNRAELRLAQAKVAAAQRRVERSVLRARSSGIVMIDEPSEWSGRAVRTGERIAAVANPTRVELSLDIPSGDEPATETDAPVRFFPDGNPLAVQSARLKFVSFSSSYDEAGALVRSGKADLLEPSNLQVGQRGRAAIIGPHVPIAYAIMRRPMSALRQWWGW